MQNNPVQGPRNEIQLPHFTLSISSAIKKLLEESEQLRQSALSFLKYSHSAITRNFNWHNHIKKDIHLLYPPPDEYRVQGWRWHHLAVMKDLSRLVRMSESIQWESPSDVSHFVDAFTHVHKKNWHLLLKVEQKIFFPWILTINNFMSDDSQISRFTFHRQGNTKKFIQDLSRSSNLIEQKMLAAYTSLRDYSIALKSYSSKAVHTKSFPYEKVSSRFGETLTESIRKIRDVSIKSFTIQESQIVPRVVQKVTQPDQIKLCKKINKSISIGEALYSLVLFDEVIRELNDLQERRRFEREVPVAIRKLIPLFRSQKLDGIAKQLRKY